MEVIITIHGDSFACSGNPAERDGSETPTVSVIPIKQFIEIEAESPDGKGWIIKSVPLFGEGTNLPCDTVCGTCQITDCRGKIYPQSA